MNFQLHDPHHVSNFVKLYRKYIVANLLIFKDKVSKIPISNFEKCEIYYYILKD